MSGVTGVLLSYGDPADNPFPPIPPSSSFTMTNVDIIAFETTSNPTGLSLESDSDLTGNVNVLLTPPLGSPYYGKPSAAIAGTGTGEFPALGPDSDYSGVFPAPDYNLYNDVDWGSDYPIWFGAGPTLLKSQVFFDFSAAAAGWTTQTVFTGTVAIYPYDWGLGAADTNIQVTPISGGVVERSAYASETLVVVGGTAGTPYSYINSNYLFEVSSSQYRFATFVDYTYTVATKTFYATIYYTIVPN